MNDFNTSPTGKITNGEIKTVAWILAAAVLITVFFVYALPTFYNKEDITLKNSNTVNSANVLGTSTKTADRIITPPEVNI
jgi:hypothetical protein